MAISSSTDFFNMDEGLKERELRERESEFVQGIRAVSLIYPVLKAHFHFHVPLF